VLQVTIALLEEVKQILNHVQVKHIEIQQVHSHFLIVPCVLLENCVQVLEHFHFSIIPNATKVYTQWYSFMAVL
jgi:hemoglobin-like flavoprotein